MKKMFLIIVCPLLMYGQQNNMIKKQIINPKGNWYFGAEIGTNKISSFSLGEPNTSFQGGVLAEYYFARHWSLSARIKYFETGVSFYDKGADRTNGYFFSFEGRPSSSGIFKGAVIAIPLNIKWEYRIAKNFSGNFKGGLALTTETQNDYSKYSSNLNPSDYQSSYQSLNLGYGFNYFINKKIAIYIDFEYYHGEYPKGNGHVPTNNLTNFGIKYNFKKN